MVKIYADNFFYYNQHDNDNRLRQAEMWEGHTFLGFVPVKGGWRPPEQFVECGV